MYSAPGGSFGTSLLNMKITHCWDVMPELSRKFAAKYDCQTVANYDGMTTSWNGTTLVLSNAVPLSGGQTITFVKAVPVPAAAWLFGSALGLLGWARRRTAS